MSAIELWRDSDMLGGETIGWLGLGLLLAALAAAAHRQSRNLQAAERVVERQFDVLDEEEIRDLVSVTPVAERKAFKEWLQRVEAANDGTVRLGHIYWIRDVLDGRIKADAAPKIGRSPDAPYSPRADIGIPNFRRYMRHRRKGELVDAYRALEVGARRNSPLCLNAYGSALVKGEVPGRDRDPSAPEMIERAVEGGASAVELGFVLLEGVHAPRQTASALELQETAAARDAGPAAELALVYWHGLHGVLPNRIRAVDLVLRHAPTRRQIAHRWGFDQEAWVVATLQEVVNLKRTFGSAVAPSRDFT